jgi:hypothetical protein
MLREWWLVGRPTTWLFRGRDPLLPITSRQLQRVDRTIRAMRCLARNDDDRKAVTKRFLHAIPGIEF